MIIKTQSARRMLLVLGGLTLTLSVFSAIFFKRELRGYAKEATSPALEQPGRSNTIPQPGAPEDKLLQNGIESVIASSDMPSARWGAFVVSLRDGRVVYAREADKGFVPASNMKLYTTAVALDLLGADYRWGTSVYAGSRPDANGTINGNLMLYGRGAPDLVLNANDGDASLEKLADELYRNGLRRVRGNVIGDDSYFFGDPLGDGWLWNDTQWYYGAEISALSIGGNEISLTIEPGRKVNDPARVKLEPASDLVEVNNEALTVGSEGVTTIGITRSLVSNGFQVWGEFPLKKPGFKARLAVHKPALWAANLFLGKLRARGIAVDGNASMTDVPGRRGRFDPEREVELAFLTSRSLGEVSRVINKESLNLDSELVLRTLGKEKGATVPDPDPRKMSIRGDDKAGVVVIRQWLQDKGIATQGLALHDGSGLSRLDLVTPESTARLLEVMSKLSTAGIFRDSLPIAGRDGTLRNRLRPATSRVFAKTGTLTYTNSLSGYVATRNGEVLAFSIICNNDTSLSTSTNILDEIVLLLANL